MWPGTACGLAGPTLEMPVTSQRAGRLLLWPAVLVGISVVGSLDEIVLPQRCARTLAATGGCQAAGPIADGVFHVLGATAMLVAGLMLLVQPGGRGVGRCGGQWLASCWAGSCHLFDGTVRHKLLGLGQVRAG
jgi:uncharacterized membrane protein